MEDPPTPLDRARVGLVLLAAGFAVASCAVQGGREDHALTKMKLDGLINDWPAESSIAMDENFAYFRVSVQNEEFTLQSAKETMAVALDIDGDPRTGKYVYLGKDSKGREQRLGVDLEIQLSPLDDAGGVAKKGVAFFAVDAAGKRTPLDRDPRDLIFAPTYAAKWYEFRVSRHMKSRPGLPLKGLFSSGRVTGSFVLLDRKGNITGYSDAFGIANAPPVADRTFAVGGEIPRRGPAEIRILSYNVLKASPVTNPDSFRRIIEAVNPDVLMLQEWGGEPEVIKSWFTAFIASPTSWSVVTPPGGDVAIVSRHGTFKFGPETAESVEGMPAAAGKPWSPRWTGAIIDTPFGKMAVGSAHLKCCGSSGSPEDLVRQREAQSINEAMFAGLAKEAAPMVVLGGDLNLVGSREPLDILRRGLDGGQDLLIIDPTVMGDGAKYTWVDEKSEFSAGRLDYLTFSASTLDVTRAFVLDTQILSDEALFRMGLARDDSAGSDHLPVVIDVKPLPAAMAEPKPDQNSQKKPEAKGK